MKDFLEKFRVQHPKDDEEIAVAVWTVKDVKTVLKKGKLR